MEENINVSTEKKGLDIAAGALVATEEAAEDADILVSVEDIEEAEHWGISLEEKQLVLV